jgi:hypothetical protein
MRTERRDEPIDDGGNHLSLPVARLARLEQQQILRRMNLCMADPRRVALRSRIGGAAVYCAMVVRNPLLVGGTKPTLKSDASVESLFSAKLEEDR